LLRYPSVLLPSIIYIYPESVPVILRRRIEFLLPKCLEKHSDHSFACGTTYELIAGGHGPSALRSASGAKLSGSEVMQTTPSQSSKKLAPSTCGWHHADAEHASSEEKTFMSISPTKVLVATDGSREAQLAAQTAADLAQMTHSELHVVHVFGIAPVGPPVYPQATTLQSAEFDAESDERQRISERGARELLDAEVQRIRSGGRTVAGEHLIEGWVASGIVGLAEELGAGLIVMGSRGLGGIRRALMGSVSDSVVRHGHCPVMVVRE
jgi:nucleotide-binding universal stress UspA family protein